MDYTNPQVNDVAVSPDTGLEWEVRAVDDTAGVTLRRRRSAYRTDHGAIDDHGGYEQTTVPWATWEQAFNR